MDLEAYMRRAIEIARDNPDAPFGCVIVDAGSGDVVPEGLSDARGALYCTARWSP